MKVKSFLQAAILLWASLGGLMADNGSIDSNDNIEEIVKYGNNDTAIIIDKGNIDSDRWPANSEGEFTHSWSLELMIQQDVIEVHASPETEVAITGAARLTWQYLSEGWGSDSGSINVTLIDSNDNHLADLPPFPQGIGLLRLTLMQNSVFGEATFQLSISSESITIHDSNQHPNGSLIEKSPATLSSTEPGTDESWNVPEMITSENSSGGVGGRSQVHYYNAESLPSNPWYRTYFTNYSSVAWGTSTAAYTQGSASIWVAGYDSNNTSSRTCSTSSCTYVNNMHTVAYAAISLGSYSSVNSLTLTFDLWYDLESSFDFLYVMASGDGGTTWSQLANYTGNGTSWATKTLDLTSYKGNSNFVLYFRMTSDGSVTGMGAFVDDVEITSSTSNQPDLVANWLSGPTSGTAGSSYTVTRAFQNSGSASAGSFTYGIYLSTNNFISTSDILAYSYTYSSGMASGSSSNISISVTIPSSISSGSYYWGLLVDINNTVSESNENNNALATSGTITIGGSGYVSVDVTLLFYDYYQANNSGCSTSNNNCYSPAAFTKVELWDYDNLSGNDLLYSSYLNSSGKITISNINNRETLQGNQDLYFKFYAQTYAAEVMTYSSQTAYSWTTGVVWNVADGSYSFGNQYITTNQGALFIAISMLDSRSEANTFGSSNINQIEVRWPTSSGAFYQSVGPYIALYDGFGATVIFHEYGHYVSDYYSSHTGGGGAHSFNSCTSNDLGWSEGWASFFTIHTKTKYNYFKPTWYKTWYEYESGRPYNQNGWATVNNPSNGTHWQCLEEVVTGILWDIYDGTDDDVDNDHFGDGLGTYNAQYMSTIWNAAMNYNPSHDFTLADFTTSLLSTSSSLKEDYFDILVEHGVRPDFSCSTSTYSDGGLSGDAGGALSSASTISAGHYNGCLDSSTDTDDFYKIYVPSGKELNVIIVSPASSDFDLYLMTTGGSTLSSSTGTVGMEWSNTSNNGQYIVVHVSQYSGSGLYGLDINISNARPNLEAIWISGPSLINPGGTASVTRTFQNTGSTFTGGFIYGIYVISSTSSTLVYSYNLTSGMSAGSSSNSTITVNIPSNLSSGVAYSWGLWVDISNNIIESNEVDNSITGGSGQVGCSSTQNDGGTGGDAPSTQSGALSVGNNPTTSGYYLGCMDSTDTIDYWMFSMSSGYNVDIQLTSPLTGDFDIYLVHSNGTILDSFSANITILNVSTFGTSISGVSGTYYIKLDVWNGCQNSSGCAGDYQLRFWTNQSYPDLVATNVSGSSTGTPGGMASVSYRIDNLGAADAGGFNFQIRLSTNDIISTSDVLVTTNSYSSLVAGGYVYYTFNVTIPSSLSVGNTYYWGLMVDTSNVITESNENNNVVASSGTITIVSLPNLEAVWISGPSLINPGGTASVTRSFANTGGSAAGSFTYGLYLSTNNIISTGDTLVYSYNFTSGMSSGSSSNGTISVNIPTTLVTGTTYYWGVLVDIGGDVTESDESDNDKVGGGTTVGCPSVQNDGGSGGDAVGNLTSSLNVGSNPNTGSSYYSGCLDSSDTSDYWGFSMLSGYDVDILVTSPTGADFDLSLVDVSGNYLGGSTSSSALDQVSTSGTNASGDAGTYFVNVYQYSGVGYYQIKFWANQTYFPDLVANWVSGPTEMNPGETVSVQRDLENDGDLKSGAFKYGIYISTDSFISTTDILIYDYSYTNGFNTGTYSNTSISITIPSTIAAGTYYWGLIVDTDDDVIEWSEVNNDYSGGMVYIGACQYPQDDMGQGFDAPSVNSGNSLSINQGNDYGCVDQIDENDVYSLGVTGNTQTIITLQSQSGSDLKLELMDSSGYLLDSSSNSGSLAESVMDITPISKMYYIIVSHSGGDGGDYYLTISIENLPDLIITGMTVSTPVTAGSNITAQVIFNNQGSASASAFEMELFLSNNYILDSTDLSLNTQQYQGLSIGAQANINVNAVVDLFTEGGVYYLCLLLNSDSTLNESVSTNNWQCSGLFIEEPTPGIPISLNQPSRWVNTSTINLQWLAPSGGGATITHYFYQVDGGTGVNVTSTSIEISLTEGDHIIEIRAVNELGNDGGVLVFHIGADRTPPSEPNVEIADWFGAQDQLELELGDCEDDLSGLARMEYRFSGTWQTITSDYLELQLDEGVYSLQVRCVDNAGNLGTYVSRTIQIDLSPPTSPTIIGPSGWVSSQILSYQLTPGVDFLSGMSHTEFSIDGGIWVPWDDTNLSLTFVDGEHSILAKSIDVAGNPSLIVNLSFIIDNEAPTFSMIETEEFYMIDDEIVIILPVVVDSGSGFSHYSWMIDGGDWVDVTTVDLEIGTLNGGINSINVIAVDNVGNPSVSQTLILKIDDSPPEKPIISCPAGWVNISSITCVISEGIDNISGISHLEYQIGDDDWTELDYSKGVVELQLPDGVFNISFRWFDLVGQSSGLTIGIIQVDTKPPSVSVIQTGVLDEYGTDSKRSMIKAIVSINASDDGAGINRIEYSIDNGLTWHLIPSTGYISPPSEGDLAIVEGLFRVQDKAGNEVIQKVLLDFSLESGDQFYSDDKSSAADINSYLMYGGGGLFLLLLVLLLLSVVFIRKESRDED